MEYKGILISGLQHHQEMMSLIMQDGKLQEAIVQVVQEMISCFENKGKVFFCGNGGSAADAQHLSAELAGRFRLDRPGLSSEALHCNTSYLTAVANDYSFDKVYSRLIAAEAQKGDILIGLSTSGNSKNIIEAFKVCKKSGVKTIAFTGNSGGKMAEMADLLVAVPSVDTPRIQEAHITLGHMVCELVEASLFGKKD